MKKHTEKPPIDELFAQKLGNMSMRPNADGFARLQARMGQGQQPEAKMVFWRNPVIQRAMAAAACLLLVCLFGWRYWPSGHATEQGQVAIATNQTKGNPAQKSAQKQPDLQQPDQKTETPDVTNKIEDRSTNQVAIAEKGAKPIKQSIATVKPSADRKKAFEAVDKMSAKPMVAQTKPSEAKVQPDVATQTPVATEIQLKASVDQLAENKAISKPIPVAERVLDVTIDEPTALAAARQIARPVDEEKVVLAQNNKPEKEARSGSLWQQVKRIKRGEVLARRDNANEDEGGLLGRAYSGLKHSFDKDKSAKQ